MVENEARGDRELSSDDDDDKEEPFCPLFMERLPRDFSSNPQLLAIASLLEEEEEVDDEKKKNESSTPARPVAAPKLGGGKLRSVKNRTRRAAAPYPKQNKPSKTEASMGEAQLFLKLWKL